MVFNKKAEESDEEFLLRMLGLKHEYSLTWDNVKNVMNHETGSSLSTSGWKHRAQKLQDTYLPEIKTETGLPEDLADNYIVHAEFTAIRDEKAEINAMYRRMSREDSIIDIAKQYAELMNKSLLLNIEPPSFSDKDVNSGILVLSDWHYGVEYSGVYNTYNTDVAKERIQSLKDKAILLAKQNKVKDLHVLNLGDLIAGNIHLPLRINSRIDVISQIMEVSELLAELLASLSQCFTVHYYSCIDNHSRIDPNKKEALQLENLTRITDWYIKDRVPNITYHENEFGLDVADLEVGDFQYLAVHGDVDKKKNLINKLSSYTMYHWDGIFSAHLHHFECEEENNTLRLSNGSLMGQDDYSHQLRLTSRPSQTLVIVSEDNPFAAIYKIDV